MTGRLQEAIPALRRAAELEPNSAERLAKLAFAEHADHRDSDAIRHLQQAAQLYGKSFPFAGALGLLLAQQHRPEEARKWLALSRPEEGDFAAARLELAALELKAGNRTRARELLREALIAAPQLKAQVLADPDLAPLVSE
jgi:Flp pilus assembly protein TadD